MLAKKNILPPKKNNCRSFWTNFTPPQVSSFSLFGCPLQWRKGPWRSAFQDPGRTSWEISGACRTTFTGDVGGNIYIYIIYPCSKPFSESAELTLLEIFFLLLDFFFQTLGSGWTYFKFDWPGILVSSMHGIKTADYGGKRNVTPKNRREGGTDLKCKHRSCRIPFFLKQSSTEKNTNTDEARFSTKRYCRKA